MLKAKRVREAGNSTHFSMSAVVAVHSAAINILSIYL